jgi:hypothetical protein
MKFNPVTKSIFSALFTKMADLEHRLPKDERERIYYLRDLCRSWNLRHAEIDTEKYFIPELAPTSDNLDATDFDIEEYIKLNGVLLWTIWFSENNYDGVLQIEALENIVREYRRNPLVNDYIAAGEDITNCLQMLLRNYIENPDCPNALLLTTLDEYDKALGSGEELAFGDDSLNYLAMRGELDSLLQLTSTLLALAPGDYSDCYACIINRLIRWHILTDEYEGASILIDMVFADKLTCDLIPKATRIQKILVDEMLMPGSGNPKAAEKTGLKNLAPRDEMVYEACFLLRYSMLVENRSLGEKVLERFAGIVERISTPEKIYYCLAAYEFSGDHAYRDSGLALAKRYDARNGRSFYEPLFSHRKADNS